MDLIKKRSGLPDSWRFGFLLAKKRNEMKSIQQATFLKSFTRILIGFSLLLISSPVSPVGLCAENEIQPAPLAVKDITIEEAVNISREYLKIKNAKDYQIIIKDKVITADAFNTYRVLESGVKRLCWVVTFVVPDAVGGGRTVYVDRENGEILGGYSSK